MNTALTKGNEATLTRRQVGVALAVGTVLGTGAMLVLDAAIALAWRLDPAPADATLWLRPTLVGLLSGAMLSGIGCGVGAAAVLGWLSGRSGRLRLTPVLLLTLVWAVAPTLALMLA